MNGILEGEFIGAHEETYNGYDIFVDENRDHNRGGYEWSVCKDETEWDSGLEFIAKSAIESAHKAVDSLVKNNNG
jgi:hypothetical protein